jgi:hypothetical protein
VRSDGYPVQRCNVCIDRVSYKLSHSDFHDEIGPENDDVWLCKNLSLLSKLYAPLRNCEQLVALVLEVGHAAKALFAWRGHLDRV